MFRMLMTLLKTARSAFRCRAELVLENAALRQQLAAYAAKGDRPRIRPADRVFWVVLQRLWTRAVDWLVFVKPTTLVKWHQRGFKLFWALLSRRRGRNGGRERIDADVRELIREMAMDNGWGAPRIHGELRMLGIDISERTVSRYLRRLGPRKDRAKSRQSWRTFLRNHADEICAMDFFTIPTATFRVLYVLFVIRHSTREILHFNVTANPNEQWVCQQMREAFPWDTAPEYLLFDRDAKFGDRVVRTVKNMGVEPVRTAYRCPWQNPIAERMVGNFRRDIFDHAIVLGEDHVRRLLRSYTGYYHEDRTHCGLAKQTPLGRKVTPPPSGHAEVVALPRVGGLHHRYVWRSAA